MADTHYDVIIIGSGPGGGATAAKLAPMGKRILLLERGEYLPRTPHNWDSKSVFVDGKYQAKETWYDSKGNSFAPGLHYFVGGNSKVYGAALLRMRERDFGEVEQVVCVDPTLRAHDNLTLLTGAYVSKLETDPSGERISGVVVERDGEVITYTVVVACGALSSALLLLRSANDKHPNGLANRSGQLGRNYMRHNQSVLMALTRHVNDTIFQKTLALSDFYFASEEWRYPLGLIQMCAITHGAQIKGEVLPEWLKWFPDMPFEMLARRSLDFWLTSEDLPRPENRIFYDGGKVTLDVAENNMEAPSCCRFHGH